MNRIQQTAIGVVIGLLVGISTVSAQTPQPTPTFSSDVLATQAALEAAIDALPVIATEIATLVNDAVPEVTEEAANVDVNVTVNNPAPVEATPTEPAGVPQDTVHIAMVVGGIVAVAVIGVAAFLLKTTGDQLYNSLPPMAQYGVRAGGEYLLSRAALTPQEDDDAAIEAALKLLGFVVERTPDGTITLRRTPAPVVAQSSTAVTPQTTVTFTGAALTREDMRREFYAAFNEVLRDAESVAVPQAPPLAEADAEAAERQRIAEEGVG